MRRKIAAIGLVLGMIANQCVFVSANSDEPDVLRGIFSGIDSVDPNERELDLPYSDGEVLSDVREPMYITANGSKVLGESSFASDAASWKSADGYALSSASFTVGGKKYTVGSEYKVLRAAEGDFDGDGTKGELALIAAAKTSDKKSLLLLCTSSAKKRDGKAVPIAVLYSGTGEFYDNTNDFANCLEVVCADVNGDGRDEIVTATPTGGITERGTDKYKLDKFSGAYLWNQTEGVGSGNWNSADGWNSEPSTFLIGLTLSYGENCILGAPGTTASLAAGDVDGDGFDDLAVAISTTKARFNANYAANQYSVCYIGGAPTVGEMAAKRKWLVPYIGRTIEGDDISLSAMTGDAAGFDVEICDVDGSGKPTIFMSFKKTVHHWAAMSGNKMFTPSFYIYSFDMKDDGGFVASLVHRGGIYHHGWMGGGDINDTDYVYRLDTIDCAPVRIGVLRGDFGLSGGKSGYASSGTIIADQRYFSFVRTPDGDKYSYEISNSGSYTGTWGAGRSDNGHGFADNDCVFYRNGINVTDIKTANIRFDGKKYEDAALASAYTADGFKTYCIMPSGSGYTASAIDMSAAPSAAIAAPDTDNDSIYLKYNKHRFFWADPVIIAALASPPYFDSLPSDMYSNSQTTYGKSILSSTGKSESYTVSAGSYVSTEIKGGGLGTSAVFEAESEAMSSSSSGREESVEVSYTQSFSASGGGDTVVLSTVAYDAYSYTAYYPGANGELAESPYVVYVPHGGSDSIRIASLNYGDYLRFAKYADGALPELGDVFTHTVGKPETYPGKAPSGAGVLSGSVITHNKLAGFPSDTSSQTLSIDITKETSETTSSGSSVSVKLGGGFEAEADDIFGLVNTGSKISIGSSSEKEYESGKIKTNAVGTTFEGTVFGQGDGMNVSGGSDERAYFNWRLLHYIHNFKDGDSVQQFPVVTYITSGVIQPSGVVPGSLSVSPAKMSVEQVGPKTAGYVNEVGFTAQIEGVSRESYTALEGAPLGMTLNTGGSNIGQSGSYPFGIRINSNVKPGEYELMLNVGGKLSNPFVVVVEKYTDPVWIETDSAELDFGSMRYNYYAGTPAAAAQTVTVKNIHTESIANLSAELDENSDFEITEQLSPSLIYAKDLQNSTAAVKVAPKKGLGIGEHTGTLKITNGVTSAFVTLRYNVTRPTVPGAPSFLFAASETPNPIKLLVEAPEDDGGGRMTHYLYTIKDHPNYVQDGHQIWKEAYNTAQSGQSFYLQPAEDLTVGEKYTIGLKAVTTAGESEAAWHDFEVTSPPDDPAPVQNIKVYPGDKSITLTWDPPMHWGENRYCPTVNAKRYIIMCNMGRSYTMNEVYEGNEREFKLNGLENGREYEISISAATADRETKTVINAAPSADIIAPSRPTELRAYMSYRQAEITWSASCYVGDGIVKYQVSKDGGTSWIDVMPTDSGKGSYTFSDLIVNRDYDFCVRAVNSKGTGDLAKTTQTVPSNLLAPSGNSAVRGYNCIEMIWYALTDESVTGYEVKLDDGDWKSIQPVKFGDMLHYVFTGLVSDKEYTTSVRGVNSEGGGGALSQTRTTSSDAPLPPINPHVEALNSGIGIYAQKQNPDDTLSSTLDGVRWYTFNDYIKIDGLENGKEYTVGISTSGTDKNGITLRNAEYFTVTPDASLPKEPSEPIITAYIGDDYVRVQWDVEDDGGTPVEYYEVTVGDSEPIVLPNTEKSILISRPDSDADDGGVYICVEAFNAAGSSYSTDYIYCDSTLEGADSITLTSTRSENYSAPYKLTSQRYMGEDESGEPIFGDSDLSDYAEWNMQSDSNKIIWDSANHRIVIDKSLGEGIYSATVTANYYGSYYEKNVEIVIGNAVRIDSAEFVSGGVSVELSIPQELGEKYLCLALYNQHGHLTESAIGKVSFESITDGKVFVPINTAGAVSGKAMLLDNIRALRPLCKSNSFSASRQ